MRDIKRSATSSGRKPGAEERISEHDRVEILASLRGPSSWVGGLVPEQEEIEGKRIPLRDVVYRYTAVQTPTSDDIEGALALANVLQKKAEGLENVIGTEDISRSKAMELEEHVRGLLKASDALRHLKGDALEIKARALDSKVADERRWLEFVRRIR
ncbi:MAG: DUF5788 family protein [Methanomassiliicoccales archaeon]|nr:DUF5788 family protein [Methanomassiliicoccales archaeon]